CLDADRHCRVRADRRGSVSRCGSSRSLIPDLLRRRDSLRCSLPSEPLPYTGWGGGVCRRQRRCAASRDGWRQGPGRKREEGAATPDPCVRHRSPAVRECRSALGSSYLSTRRVLHRSTAYEGAGSCKGRSSMLAFAPEKVPGKGPYSLRILLHGINYPPELTG